MKKNFTFLLFAMSFYFTKAQVATSLGPGNWNDPTKWSIGVVPNSSNCTSISIVHTITVTANATIDVPIAIGNISGGSGKILVNAGINFTIDYAAFINTANAKLVINVGGALENKGNCYINAAVEVLGAGQIIQNTTAAIITMDGSDGTAATSIPDGTSLLKIGSQQGSFIAGTLKFLQPPYGATSVTFESAASTNPFPTSSLSLFFGGTTTPTTLNTDGFVIKQPSNLLFNMIVGDVTIDNTTGSGGGQKVSMKPLNLYCKNLTILDGELRADNTTGFANTIAFSSFLYNTGTLTCYSLLYNGNNGSNIDGTGTFRNNITAPTASVNSLTVQNNGSIPFSVDVPNFSVNGLTLSTGILSINNNNLTINTGVSGLTVSTPSSTKYIATAGTGKLIIKQPAGTIITTVIPIGTSTNYAPLSILQISNSPAEDFSFSAAPLTGVNDVTQTNGVKWQILEATTGGNNLTVQFGKASSVGANFAESIADVYNDNAGTWTKVTNPNYQYYPTQATFKHQPLGNATLAERGFFTLATGKGISNTGQNAVFSTSTGNWNTPSTWAGGIVPANGDLVVVKTGHIVTVNAFTNSIKNLENNGTININASQGLFVGNLDGDNATFMNNGTLTIGSGFLYISGELYSSGTFSKTAGGMFVDPNSGTASTSLQNTTRRFSSPYAVELRGTNTVVGDINFRDPFIAGSSVTAYMNAFTNTNFSGINYIYGDNSSLASSGQFNDYLLQVTSSDNLFFNLGSEVNNTMIVDPASGSVNCNNVTINSGNIDRGASQTDIFYVYGNMQLNGNFNFYQVGFYAGSNKTLSGTGSLFVQRLVMSLSGGADLNCTLGGTLTVPGGGLLTLTSGRLILNNTDFVCNLPTTPVGSANSFIVTNGTGKVKALQNVNTVRYYPIGASTTSFTPIQITGAASGHTADSFYVSVKPNVIRNPLLGNAILGEVVDRTWDITEKVAGGSNVNLTAQWNVAEELVGFNRNACYIAHYTGAIWDVITATAATGTGPYSITRNGVTSFSPFAVTSSTTSLPLNWLNYNGIVTNNYATLYWNVVESNVKLYILQSSIDGIGFNNVKTIISYGNGNNNYSLKDDVLLKYSKYYRVQQVDINGSTTYSKIIKLSPNTKINFSIVSNNSNKNLVVIFNNSSLINSEFKIFNSIGQILIKEKINATTENINISKLNPGVYYLYINNNSPEKFIKQ